MGRPWSIVTCSVASAAAAAARWQPLVERVRCPTLRIPIRGEQEYLSLARGEPARRYGALDVETEIRLLETPDLTWDHVDRLFAGQMVFLPVTGVVPFPIKIPGFEPNTCVGGLDRLLALSHRTEPELMLRAAATLATYHRFAIEVGA
jgi:hypothetical protein